MEPTNASALDRPLRLLTYLATAITIPLNIAATIMALSRRNVSAFCFVFIPLAMTVAASSASLHYMKKQGKSPRVVQFKVLDLVSAITYLGVLIPCWAVELQEYNEVGFGLLAGYVTAPMILNMSIHIYFTLNHLPWKKNFSKIYSLVALNRQSTCQQCPNCQATFVPSMAQTKTKKGYSLLRGEEYLDAETDPIQYRDSEDFLGEGADRAEQPAQARTAEENDKANDLV